MSDSEYRPASRKELIQALMPFAQSDTRLGLRQFIVDYAIFLVGLALALFTANLLLRTLGALLIGLKTSGLYTLSHDASHNSLTASRKLNKALAVLGLMPTLMNQRLWAYDHVVMHHVKTNGPQTDIFRPMSLADYRAAPAWRRAWERLTRSASVLARAPVGMVASRWLIEKVVPNRAVHSEKVRREAWPITALLACWFGGMLLFMVVRHGGEPLPVLLDALFVFVLPICIFWVSLGNASYIQHTHPAIPWFEAGDKRMADCSQEELTTHVQMPPVLAGLIHNGLEHAAHHVLPAIPNYRLREAQTRLNELLKGTAVVMPLSLRGLREVARSCKLYDYQNHRWLDFDGNPTTPSLVCDAHRAPVRAAA